MGPASSPPASFILRVPGVPLDVDTLLARLHPASDRAAREALVAAGSVCADGRPVRKPAQILAPGARVELAGALGPERAEDAAFPGGGGADLQALVPSLPWTAGTLARRRGMSAGVHFERLARHDGLDRIALRPDPDEIPAKRSAPFARDALNALAAAGHPVLGDTRRGGVLVEGGLRLGPLDADELPWPSEPVFPGADPGAPMPELPVSHATRRILAKGHPWILRDDETGDTSGLAAGTPVRVRGPGGDDLGIACVEGPGTLVARIWEEPRRGSGRRGASALSGGVAARVDRAWQRRASLLATESDTDVFRLVHAEADGLPGLHVDLLGSVLRVLVTTPGDGSYRTAALDLLAERVGDRLGVEPSVVEVLHLREVPPGDLVRTRLVRGPVPGGDLAASTRLPVRERGVRFLVDPGLTRPLRSSPGYGLYPDQRDNRARLAEKAAAGGRLLNLFAHTGAFSVAWLAAGGEAALSVDLSRPYLGWLEENLAANGIDPARHRSVRRDGRRFLDELDPGERFDAIVLDPPTAAAAGRRFWSVGRDLAPLVAQAVSRLAPGGQLLVCRNDRRRSGLPELAEQAAREVGVRLARISRAGPGRDHPRRPGFPEGDPFSGVLVERA